MRKSSAILFLTLLFLSQYAKQVVYLECRLGNAYKSFAVECDCEKKAGLDKQDNNPSPLSKTHSHIYLDELFPVTKENTLSFSLPATLITHNPFESDDDCDGCTGEPFHPPRCWSHIFSWCRISIRAAISICIVILLPILINYLTHFIWNEIQ